MKRISEIGEIKKPKPPTPISHLSGVVGVSPEDFGKGIMRISQVAVKSFYEDLPFLRQMHGIPKSAIDVEPETGLEKTAAISTKLLRDVLIWKGAGPAVGIASKLKPISNLGSTISHLGKYGGMINKIIPEFAKGAMLGGLTSGEEGDEIAKKALTYGVFTGAIPPAVSGLSLAGRGIWKYAPKAVKKPAQAFGEWLGLVIKDSKARMAAMKRTGDIAANQIDDANFRYQLNQQITPLEDELLPFYMEREIGGLTKAMKKQIRIGGLGKKLEKTSKLISQHLDNKWQSILKNTDGDLGFIEQYIPHIWDIPKGKEQKVITWFQKLNPHTKKRLFATLNEGMKEGFVPKHRKVTDLLKVYDEIATHVNANNVFAKELNAIKIGGTRGIMRADKAPKDWKTLDHSALRRAIGIKKGGKLFVSKLPVKVHPDIYDSVDAVFGKPIDSNTLRNINKINALAKQGNFLFSLFHHTALTETAFSVGLEKEALKAWNPAAIIKELKKGNKAVFKNIELSKDAVRHTLQVGEIIDVQRNVVEKSLLEAETNLRSLAASYKSSPLKKIYGKTGETIIKTIRKPIEFNNRFLWDYLHSTYKLSAYEKLTADMLTKFPNKPIDIIKNETAQFVNDSFGGQQWALLNKTPQWKQLAHFLLLSPDWTLSTARQAFALFGTGAQSAAGAAIRRELGSKFWRKAILYFVGGANLLNHAVTKATDGEGRFMFQNGGKNNTRIFIGRDKDGRERYMRHGKQFREIFEWAAHPLRTLGNKTSPFIRQAVSQATGYTPSGWKTGIAKARTKTEKITAMAGELVNMFMPFSKKRILEKGTTPIQKFIGQAVATSKGESEYNIKKMLRQAVLKKEEGNIKKICLLAERNGYNSDKLLLNALKYNKRKRKS